MSRRASVRVTPNFERNLENIRRYLEENGGSSAAFEALLDQLFDAIVPNLESSPAIGFDFLARAPQSFEGIAAVKALEKRMGKGASIREYIAGDYLLLYAWIDAQVYLLSIKHHRQLSFDLRGQWNR